MISAREPFARRNAGIRDSAQNVFARDGGILAILDRPLFQLDETFFAGRAEPFDA